MRAAGKTIGKNHEVGNKFRWRCVAIGSPQPRFRNLEVLVICVPSSCSMVGGGDLKIMSPMSMVNGNKILPGNKLRKSPLLKKDILAYQTRVCEATSPVGAIFVPSPYKQASAYEWPCEHQHYY